MHPRLNTGVRSTNSSVCLLAIVSALSVAAAACGQNQPKPGTVRDEAMLAARTAASFPAADEDYFHDMDGGLPLTKEQIAGRNMWLVWTGGDDRLWDVLSVASLGSLDFLKTVSSHPTLPYSRDTRWNYLGLVNEPCFKKATGPDPNRYGLWLDVRDPACAPDPFANADKYKGVQVGARGKTVGIGSYYGEPSGIVGLRLFPNPAFDAAARKKWDSERYYRDPSYYQSRDLVKPYRVGMSCGFCHVGPNPLKPPADPENPRWANLSSNVGAQFFWWDRIFDWKGATNQQSFGYQALHTSLPGTLDTSLVSTDNINNPRTMNAVYYLGPRMGLAKRWGKETISGGGLDNRQFNDFVPAGDPLAQFFQAPSTTWTPRVLKDGSDSVGALGALNRVYINIGLFSEEWLLHFRPLIGGQKITPIKIADARKNSVYWQATEQQTPNMARFFLASTDPHYLKDAPDGASYLTEDADSLRRGKTVFAERCARCHSSKQPSLPAGLDMEACNGKDYLGCWTRYWAWTKTDEFKALDAADRARGRLPEGQLPVDRAARAIDADADQYLQPDRDQCHWREHLGQFLLPVLQGSAVGRDGPAAKSAHRRRVRLHLARRRPRVHATCIAREPLVHRAVPAEQQRRPVQSEPVGPGPHGGVPGVDRTDALARAAQDRRSVHATQHQRSWRRMDSADDGRELHQGARRIRAGRTARSARVGAAPVSVPVPKR